LGLQEGERKGMDDLGEEWGKRRVGVKIGEGGEGLRSF